MADNSKDESYEYDYESGESDENENVEETVQLELIASQIAEEERDMKRKAFEEKMQIAEEELEMKRKAFEEEMFERRALALWVDSLLSNDEAVKEFDDKAKEEIDDTADQGHETVEELLERSMQEAGVHFQSHFDFWFPSQSEEVQGRSLLYLEKVRAERVESIVDEELIVKKTDEVAEEEFDETADEGKETLEEKIERFMREDGEFFSLMFDMWLSTQSEDIQRRSRLYLEKKKVETVGSVVVFRAPMEFVGEAEKEDEQEEVRLVVVSRAPMEFGSEAEKEDEQEEVSESANKKAEPEEEKVSETLAITT